MKSIFILKAKMEELRRLQEIANLESELNCLNREKEVKEQQYERKRQELLQLSSVAITGQRHTELIRQMVELNSQWRRDSDKLNTQIFYTTHALNRKKRNQ
jgi:hypothetical protein